MTRLDLTLFHVTCRIERSNPAPSKPHTVPSHSILLECIVLHSSLSVSLSQTDLHQLRVAGEHTTRQDTTRLPVWYSAVVCLSTLCLCLSLCSLLFSSLLCARHDRAVLSCVALCCRLMSLEGALTGRFLGADLEEHAGCSAADRTLVALHVR